MYKRQYIGNSGVCEIPENTTLKGLTPSWAEGSPITKLIINDNVNIDMVLSGELVKFDKLKEVEFKGIEGIELNKRKEYGITALNIFYYED